MKRLLRLHMRARRGAICVFLLFVAVFAAVFALYGLPLRAVLYPALLCAVLGLLALAVDVARTCAKHRTLLEVSKLVHTAHTAIPDALPDAADVAEADYREICCALQGVLEKLENDAAFRARDTEDYYTVWAHQIKTPIASMQLALQNEDTALSRRLSADLFRIEQYVDMVLAFLRLDSVSSDYVFRAGRVDAIARREAARFASEFVARKIAFVFEPFTLSVVTDEKWLSFVIGQLLSNALKYTRQGSVRIYLEAPATLCIEDTGIGIAPEDLPRVFEKGYTGGNGRTDQRATGLGLYLCRRVCDNLGIGIRIDSEPDVGTRVSLCMAQSETRKE